MKNKTGKALSTLPLLVLLGVMTGTEAPSFLFAALCAIVWHETGHIIFFLLSGAALPRLAFDHFSLRLQSSDILTAVPYFFICAGGSLFNLVTGIVLYRFSGGMGTLAVLGGVQLLYGLFNLLPIGTMDGGRISLLFFSHVWPKSPTLPFRILEGVALGLLFFFSFFCFLCSASGLYGMAFSIFFFFRACKENFEKNEFLYQNQKNLREKER